MRVAYRAELVGNPETGVVHGGVITTLLDSVCGLAVFSSFTQMRPVATLDLRIDYLKPQLRAWIFAPRLSWIR